MKVFLTGGTGYMGRRLAGELLQRGYGVTALVRRGSENRAAAGCDIVFGDALNAVSFRHVIPEGCTFIHLVGVAHPSPAKAAQFRAIDLVSIRAAVEAARFAKVRNFIYVSVAHPAPVMKAYIEVRSEGEGIIRSAGLNATILRPWYVVGPGHWWPLVLAPAYWLMERIPATRESARRLGLVNIQQMIAALADATDHPGDGVRVVDVPGIRAAGKR